MWKKLNKWWNESVPEDFTLNFFGVIFWGVIFGVVFAILIIFG